MAASDRQTANAPTVQPMVELTWRLCGLEDVCCIRSLVEHAVTTSSGASDAMHSMRASSAPRRDMHMHMHAHMSHAHAHDMHMHMHMCMHMYGHATTHLRPIYFT